MIPQPQNVSRRLQRFFLRGLLGAELRDVTGQYLGLDLGVWRAKPLAGPIKGDPIAMQVLTAIAIVLGAKGNRYDRRAGSRNPFA